MLLSSYIFSQDYDNHKIDLTTYSNDTQSMKTPTDGGDIDLKEQQMKVLHETIRNLQTQLIENKTKEKENVTAITNLEAKLKQANVKELLLKTKIVEVTKQQSNQKTDSSDIEISENESEQADDECVRVLTPSQILSSVDSKTQNGASPSSQVKVIDADDARLIGLVSTFLVVHPFGASLDYVFSYVQRMSPFLRPKELEEILSRYTSIFCEEVTGVGAKIERKWKFCGFDTQPEPDMIIK